MQLLIGHKTVDGIVSAFKKTINDLNAVAEASTSRIASNVDVIKTLEQTNAQLETERSRATAIAKNLSGLID